MAKTSHLACLMICGIFFPDGVFFSGVVIWASLGLVAEIAATQKSGLIVPRGEIVYNFGRFYVGLFFRRTL